MSYFFLIDNRVNIVRLIAMNATGIVYLFGAGLGFFLAAGLFLKKGRAGKYFALFALLLSYELFVEYIYMMSGWRSHWVLFFIKEALGFLYGPLLYLYTSTITGTYNRLSPKHLLHLLPVIMYLCIDVNTITPIFIDPTYLLQDIDDRGVNQYRIIVRYARLGIIAVYLAATFNMIYSYKKMIGEFFSNHQKIGITWLQVFISVAGIIWIAGFSSSVIFMHYPEYMGYSARGFFFLTIMAVYAAGYFALTQPEIYSIIHGMSTHGAGVIENPGETKLRYAKNIIPPETKNEYRDKIIACFDNDKIYLDPDLTLTQLSERTGIPGHTVSQVINDTMKVNFYTLVNRYRSDYAAELLSSDKEASVISICFRAGFNSKSAFNSIFKQHTGYTPSEFRARS